MASSTIHNLDDDSKTRLRVRAAKHRHSVEEEIGMILCNTVNRGREAPRDLAKFTRECFAPLGGVELELPTRGPQQEPTDFLEQPPMLV